jgi:hypothetical protein
MSWLFSQALVEEYLGDISLDGEQSVPLNGNPTQLAYCAPDKMTDFSRLFQFGMTYKPLTVSHGEDLLTLYLEDSRAKTSRQPEKAQGLKDKDQECGSTWRGWLAKYDPDSSLWRTAQCSFLEDLNESLATLPRSGMTRSGLLWELPMLEQTTKGTESGLSEKWPTPRSCSAMAATITPESAWDEKRNPNLETIVGQRMWPTPNAGSKKFGGTMQEWGGSGNWVRTQMPELARGALNPTWVEWLMGWPLGWTDLKPLVTDKSPCVPQQHGDC